ncbi:MAG: hypothetical protein J6K12_05560 [Clostridia bacterium]|nr:hypothetical protein [Clostridia bacterium]
MIKGCNKRVIVMKDTGHDMIEEAFFILRPEVAKGKSALQSEGDIIKQANMILDSRGYGLPFSDIKLNVNSARCKKHWITPFLWGLILGVCVTCFAAVFVM